MKIRKPEPIRTTLMCRNCDKAFPFSYTRFDEKSRTHRCAKCERKSR